MSEDHIRLHKPLMDYVEYFETLNRRSLPLIEKYAEIDIRFKDPFNDVRGIAAFQSVFEHMFEHIDAPKFKVTDYAWSMRDKAKSTAYLMWEFTGASRGKDVFIKGVSEVIFSPDKKVMSHIDYWDAAEYFYEKLPVIGVIIRWVKARLAI